MATKLGTLTLDLVAKIGQFVEPMNQAERKARDASEGIADSFNTASLAAKAFGAVVAGASVAGVTAFVNQTINAGNEVQKFSQLANASMAQFQYYAKGAETAGISMESFADKMKDMQDRIGDFQQTGGGPLADFFENIAPLVGVTIEQFQRLSGPEALQLFYDSLEKVGATQNDMKFYMESIISDSSLLIPLLKNGGEGFKKWGDAAQNAGAIMSDSMVEQLVLAKENLKMLDLQWQGFQATLVNNAIPVIQSVADNFDTMKSVAMVLGAYWAGTYIPVIIKGTQAIVADTAGKVTNTLASRAKTIADYEVAKSNLAATAAMVRAMGVTNAQTAAMMANARAAYQQAAASRAAAVAGTGALGLLGGPVGIGVTLAAVAAGYLLMRDSTDESTKSLRENNESVDDAIKKYKELDEVRRRSQLVSERDKLRDLGQEYEDVNSKLITATYSFSRHNDMTSEQSKQVNALIAEYKKTGDIDQFSGKINALNFISQTSKDRFNTLGGSVKDAGNEFKNQKSFVDQMAPAVKGVGDQAKQTAIETANLSAEIRKLLSEANQTIKDSAITSALADRGYNDTMIELAKKYLNVEGAIVKNEQGRLSLRADLQKMFTTEYNEVMRAKNATDARNEAEKKITQEKEKQAKLTKASTIDAVISSGEGNYNSVNLGQKGGYKASTRNLTDMTVAQILSAQRAKQFNAAGKYQTINSTLQEAVDKGVVSSAEKFTAEVQERIFKQYLVAIKRPEIKGFITGSNKATLNDALLGSAKEFASVANPSTGKSYYAGQGNNKASISAEKMTESLLAQQKVYRENIALGMDSEQAWLKSFNASTTVVKTEELDLDKFLEDMIKRKQEQADEQKAIQVSYYNEWQNLEYDNQERIKEIEKAFATDPTERDRLLGLQQKAYEDDVANWIKAQDERVKAENEANQQIILARQNAFAMMNGPLGAMVQMGVEASARASMKPEEYDRWSMNNEQQDGYSQLGDDLYSARSGIENNEYLSETEKYAQLNDAYKVYLDSKKALTEEYAKQEAEYAEYQHDNQLSMYGSLLSQAGTVWGSMTQMVKDAAGEGSAAYKAMFLAQQAIAIGQAIINTELGATAALKVDPTGFMSMMTRGIGYASVGLIAGQTIAGMAHDGIDTIPKEGTWLLDKGERVVDSRTNSDLKNYLNEARSNNSGATINITNNTGAQVNARQNPDGSIDIDVIERQLAGRLGNPNSTLSKSLKQNTTASRRR